MDNVLFFTSFLFIFVAIYATKKGLRFYSYAWFLLCFTSILVHACGTGHFLDQVAIYTVVAIGLYHFIYSGFQIIPILCFAACIIGYYIISIHHAWIHLLSMIGHTVIMYN